MSHADHPLLPAANPAQTQAIFGAMRAVAETDGPATDDDRLAVTSADRYIFGHAVPSSFEALGEFATDTFGHGFWAHFKGNGYAFPGESKGLNQAFSVPHDSVHVLTGYDTRPRGELLASTFTAAMHPKYPMAGHILPVIFSWHLKVQINEVAGLAGAALDPQEFWRALAAGAAATVDTFAPGWDF